MLLFSLLVWVDHGSTNEYFLFLKFQDPNRLSKKSYDPNRIMLLPVPSSKSTWIITTILCVTLKFVTYYINTLFSFPPFTKLLLIRQLWHKLCHYYAILRGGLTSPHQLTQQTCSSHWAMIKWCFSQSTEIILNNKWSLY